MMIEMNELAERNFCERFESEFLHGCWIACPSYCGRKERIAHDEWSIENLLISRADEAVPLVIGCLAAGGENHALYGRVLDAAERMCPGIEDLARHWCEGALRRDELRHKTEGVARKCSEYRNIARFWQGRPVAPDGRHYYGWSGKHAFPLDF